MDQKPDDSSILTLSTLFCDVTESIRFRGKEDWSDNVTANWVFACSYHPLQLGVQPVCCKVKSRCH